MRLVLVGIVSIVMGGCGILSKSSDDNTEGTAGTVLEQTVNKDEESTLTISEGALAGTEVVIPQGALSINATVNVAQVEAPSAFTSNAEVAAVTEPLQISAKGEDGSTIATLEQPLTLSLPLGDAISLVEVEKNEDNLCAFLQANDESKVVWRRSSLALSADKTKVSLTSVKLGIFQVVFCGQEELPEFQDVEETEVATGVKQDLLALVTVPASKFDFGQQRVCASVLEIEDPEFFEESSTYISMVDVPYKGADVVLRMPLPEGRALENIDKERYLFSIDFFDGDCPADLTGKGLQDWIDLGAPFATNSVSFKVSGEQFREKQLNGFIGGTTSALSLSEMPLGIGAPTSPINDSSLNSGKFCLSTEEGFGGFTLEIKEGKILNSKGVEVTSTYVDPDTRYTFEFEACDARSVNNNDSSSAAAFASFSDRAAEYTSFHILPVTLKVETGTWEMGMDTWSQEDTSPSKTDKICAEVFLESQVENISTSSFDPLDTSGKNSMFNGQRITETVTSNSGKTTHLILVPYESEDKYYIKSRANGSDCNDSPSYQGPFTSSDLTGWLAAIPGQQI